MQSHIISGLPARSVAVGTTHASAPQSRPSCVERGKGEACPELHQHSLSEGLEGGSTPMRADSFPCPGNLRHSRSFVAYRHTADPAFNLAIDTLLGQVVGVELAQRQTQSDQGFQLWSVGSGKGGEDLFIEGESELDQPFYPNTHQLRCLGFRGPKGKGDYRQLCRHLRFVVLDALHAHQQDPELWISYSRNDCRYRPQKSRYNRLHLSKHFLVQAVELLQRHGLLHNWCAPVGGIGLQSRFCAVPMLIAALPSLPHQIINRDYSLVEVVELRGEKDEHAKPAELLEYDDEETGGRSAQWRQNIHRINHHLASAELALDSHDYAPRAGVVDFTNTHLRRIFNNSDWNQGGRLYGGWWQRIPSATRRHITIGGQPTVEVDYRQLHPTMLYVEGGLPVPADTYNLHGLNRKKVKTIFNAMLNAANHQEAREAVKNDEALGEMYVPYIKSIRKQHPQIKFYGGVGLFLQCCDSHMAEQIMLRLIDRGVTVLPVHDSFIVKAEHEALLVSVMDAIFHEHYPKLVKYGDGQIMKVTQRNGVERIVKSAVARQPMRKSI